MPNTIDFTPYATGGGANVDTQANFLARANNLGAQPNSVALSSWANKLWRQSSFVSAGVATFVSNVLNINVLDDGNLTNFVTNLTNAIAESAPVQSFNGRTGAVVLTGGDVTTALGYTPLNKAGDTATGLMTFANGITVSAGLTTLGAGVTIAGGFTLTSGSFTVPAGSIADAALAVQAAHTLLGNASGASASPSPISILALLGMLGIIGDGSSYFECPFQNGGVVQTLMIVMGTTGAVSPGTVSTVTLSQPMTTLLYCIPITESNGGSTMNAMAQFVTGSFVAGPPSTLQLKLQNITSAGSPPNQVMDYVAIGIK